MALRIVSVFPVS